MSGFNNSIFCSFPLKPIKKKCISEQKSLKNLKSIDNRKQIESKKIGDANRTEFIFQNSKVLFESDCKLKPAKLAESENNSDAVTRAPTNISDSIAAKIQSEEMKIVLNKDKSVPD